MEGEKVSPDMHMMETVNGPIILYSKSDVVAPHSSTLMSEAQLGQFIESTQQLDTVKTVGHLQQIILPVTTAETNTQSGCTLQQQRVDTVRTSSASQECVDTDSTAEEDPTKDRLQCGRCGEKADGIIPFLLHKVTHVGPGLGLGCEICGTSYTRQVALTEHYKRRHKIVLVQKSERKPYTWRKVKEEVRKRPPSDSGVEKTMVLDAKQIGAEDEEDEESHINQIHMEIVPIPESNKAEIKDNDEEEGSKQNIGGFLVLSQPSALDRTVGSSDSKDIVSSDLNSEGHLENEMELKEKAPLVEINLSNTKSSDVEGSRRNSNSSFSMQDFHFILKLNSIQGNSFNYGKQLFKCLYCEHKTYWRNTLCRHMRDKHSDILGIHKYIEIKNHPVETGQKIMKMSQYLLLQKERSKVKRIRGIEKQDIPGHFPCNKCGKTFGRLRYLRKHAQTHDNDKGLLCSVCGKSFKTQTYLSQHLKVHKEKEAYQCQQCDFVSCVNSAIHSHRQIHSDGSVLCDVCGFAYTDRSTLNKHKAVHDLSRPFGCTHPGCTWRFKTDVMCKAHLRAHTTDGKFVCSRCGYAFRHKHHLQRHEKQMHGIVPQKSIMYNSHRDSCDLARVDGDYQGQRHDKESHESVNLTVSDSSGIILNSVGGEEQFELENALQNNQLVIATDEDGNTINYEMTDIAMNVAYQALLQGQEGQNVDAHTILIPQTDGSHIVFQHEEVTETVDTETMSVELSNTVITGTEEEC